MASKAQRNASAKYDKENTKGIYLKLNKAHDADIINFFETLPSGSRQGLIKSLIREYIVKSYGENIFK